MDFITFSISFQIICMKLRPTLLLLCIFGIGLFSHAQNSPKKPGKPVVENGADAIPVTVISRKKSKGKPVKKDTTHMPPPPKATKEPGKPLPHQIPNPPKLPTAELMIPAVPVTTPVMAIPDRESLLNNPFERYLMNE